MNKLLTFIAVMVITLMTIACSNQDEPAMQDSQSKGFQVVRLSDYLESSRSIDPYEVALKFDDEESYNETLEKVKKMDETEKRNFFNQIGFKGAYMIYDKSSAELDSILDAVDEKVPSDSIKLRNMLKHFITKYDGILVFPGLDTDDYTPYFPFSDTNAEILGNKNGVVIIGDSVVQPQQKAYGPTMVDDGRFREVPKAKVTIKNGKWESGLVIGRMGDELAFHTYKKRKKIFCTRYENRFYHEADVKIEGDNGNYLTFHFKRVPGPQPLGVSAKSFGIRFNFYVKDFYCETSPKNKLTKTIRNIMMM